MNTLEIAGLIVGIILMVIFWAICGINSKAEKEQDKIMKKGR